MILEIFNYFKRNKIETYFIGQHTGPCTSNYIVIRDAGSIPAMNSNVIGQQIVDIIIICPLNSFVSAKNFENKIRKLINDCPMLRRTGQETAFIVQDGTESVTKSFECIIQKIL